MKNDLAGSERLQGVAGMPVKFLGHKVMCVHPMTSA